MPLPRAPRTTVFAAVALLTLLGCQAETFGGEDPVIDPAALQVVAGVRLPGARLTISAPWMAHLADTLTLVIDDRTALLAVRDTGGPDRFFLYLPDTLAIGTHLLSWQSSPSVRTPIGQFVTGGFTDLRRATGSFGAVYGLVQPLPERMAVVGENFDLPGTQVALLDVRDAKIRIVYSASICCSGIGASYLPSAFLAYRGSGGMPWLRLAPTLGGVLADSLPLDDYWWPAHELAPGLYLHDEKHWTDLRDDTARTLQTLDGYYHPYRIAFSADDRWAVASHESSVVGAMIVDRQARTVHWSPGWIAYTRPVFLPDGRLVLYGWRRDPDYDPAANGPNGEYLAHVDPVAGALIDSVRFAEAGSPYDQPVALRSGLIVLPAWRQTFLELSFRDPNTLAEVAHIRSPEFTSSCQANNTVTALEDPVLHLLYLSGDYCATNVPIWTFQLPD